MTWMIVNCDICNCLVFRTLLKNVPMVYMLNSYQELHLLVQKRQTDEGKSLDKVAKSHFWMQKGK